MQFRNSKVTARRICITLSFLFALGLAFTPALAQASPTPIYECHNCSDSGMQSVARSVVTQKYPNPKPGDGDYATVYNLGNNRIATFWVGWYQTGGGTGGDPPRYKWQVSTAQTPANVADAFSKLHYIYIENGNSLILSFVDGNLQTPSTSLTSTRMPLAAASNNDDGCWELRGTDNAYDAAVSSAVRNQARDRLKEWIENDLPGNVWGRYTWDILRATRLVISPLLNGYEVPLVLDWKFLDGGSIAFRYNWDSAQLEHIEKTIEDCEKNIVPERKEELDGAQFRFGSSGYNLNNFTQYIYGFGGTVNLSGTGNGGWICTSSVGLKVVVQCIRQNQK
jgi:hypothetical protein